MRKFYLLLCFIFCGIVNNSSAQTYQVDTFNMQNTPALTTDALTTVAVGKGNVIWAGSLNQGLYRFKYHQDGSFTKAPMLTNHAIRQMVTDSEGRLYIGQYGSSGAQAINGGVDIIKDSSFNFTHIDALDAQPNKLKTRYVRSIYYNEQNNKLYVSNTDDLTAGNPRIGGMTIVHQVSIPNYTTSKISGNAMYNIDAVQMSAITKVSFPDHEEIWLAANRNCSPCTSPRIIRMDLFGNVLGYFDEVTTLGALPFTNAAGSPTVRAMKQDENQNVWIGMTNGSVYIYDTKSNTWFNPFLLILPGGTSINFNAIACSANKVYIGTNNGLLMYQGFDVSNPASYKLITIADGLSSNNITGIAVEGRDTLWCASAGGLMRILEEKKYLSGYQVPYTNVNAAGKEMYLPTLSIAADSSRNIRFKASGANLGTNTKILRLLEDTLGIHPDQFGKLDLLNNVGDTVMNCAYRSPIYFDDTIGNHQRFSIHLQVYEPFTHTVFEEKEISIVRPPVFFLHGLNSFGNIWDKIRQKLIYAGFYSAFQMTAIDYPNKASFANNEPVITQRIAEFKNAMADNYNLSCGKIDVVGHSMGGILGRLYLQQSNYHNDINKLITLNTPHSGSPWGNVFSKIKNGINSPFMNWTFGSNGIFLISQYAINQIDAPVDLAIGSTANAQLNSVQSLFNSKRAAVHAIYTTYTDNVMVPVPSASPSFAMTGLRWSSIKRNGNFPGIFNNAPNDNVVGDSSQKGGLTIYNLSFIDGQEHAGSSENNSVMDTIISLLKLSPLNNRFTYNGFDPATISSPFRPSPNATDLTISTDKRTRNNSTLDITSPLGGATFNSGTSVNVSITGSPDIEDIILFYGTKSNPDKALSQLNSNTVNFTINIPAEADGGFTLLATGYNDSGLVVIDTLSLNITQTSVLEKIWASGVTVVEVGDSTELQLYGKFSDGIIRNIAYNNLAVTTNPVKCTHSGQNKIQGVSIGVDSIQIDYGGFTTKARVEIIPSSGIPLPELSVGLSAKCLRDSIELRWADIPELYKDLAFLQYSTDGKRFSSIFAFTPGFAEFDKKVFMHKSPTAGQHFYRMMMTDLDGNIAYSPVSSVASCQESLFLVTPNPFNACFEIHSTISQFEVNVYDISGRIVLNAEAQNGKLKIDLKEKPSGVYSLEIMHGQNKQVHKMQKL